MEVPLVSACIGGLVSDASVYRGAEWHDAVEDGHAREKASISSRDVCVGDKGRPLLPPNKLMAPFDRGLCSKRRGQLGAALERSLNKSTIASGGI